MQNPGAMLTGLGAGAALAFFLDPNVGGRRRALIRDKVTRAASKTAEAADALSRDLANRASGAAAVLRRMREPDNVDDRVIAARVRSALGRVVSHPSAIDVDLYDGEVTLSGPIFKDEVKDVISAVSNVRGVRCVNSRLDEHENADGIPALQGQPRRTGTLSAVRLQRWSPRARLAAGIAGAVLMTYGMSRMTSRA